MLSRSIYVTALSSIIALGFSLSASADEVSVPPTQEQLDYADKVGGTMDKFNEREGLNTDTSGPDVSVTRDTDTGKETIHMDFDTGPSAGETITPDN